MVPGYVMFRLGRQTFALTLDDVREIVRLDGLERLPGTRAPMAGVIVLRGNPLPVLDVRVAGEADDRIAGEVDGEVDGRVQSELEGDVLVMDIDGDSIGVAVDQVVAVVSADELPESADAPARSLPAYVVGVRRGPGGPVLLVDLRRMLETWGHGWGDPLGDTLADVDEPLLAI